MIVDLLILFAKIVFTVIFIVLTLGALLSWVERKQSAMIQDRIGPNRASILGLRVFGLFHPIADGLKMIFKEDFIPDNADRVVHTLAPVLAMIPVLVGFAVIPFGDELRIAGRTINLVVADVNIGLLFLLAMSGLSVYGIFLGGWSSNNKWSMMGGLRALSQMISYEVTLGLSLIGAIMWFGSVRLTDMVHAQGAYLFGFLPAWGIFVQPFGFLLFLIASIAESKRAPFDLVEGESEIIGFFLEYSGLKFAMFYLGEFMEVAVLAGLLATIFFGGWQVPYLTAQGFQFPGMTTAIAMPHLLVAALQVAAFLFKVVALCWFQLLVRWTLPRFRYDQLMRLCWKNLLPLSFVNIAVTGVLIALFM
ncbi:NADH-quinone oxidoreductase subunit NuoH [bacterium]|nr:NADH-quinone oxidoreductase subunit NuoH [candidate division CSSED10-310 bacterium]